MVAKTALIGRKRDCEVTAGYRAKAKKNPPSEENQNLSLSLSLSLSLYIVIEAHCFSIYPSCEA